MGPLLNPLWGAPWIGRQFSEIRLAEQIGPNTYPARDGCWFDARSVRLRDARGFVVLVRLLGRFEVLVRLFVRRLHVGFHGFVAEIGFERPDGPSTRIVVGPGHQALQLIEGNIQVLRHMNRSYARSQVLEPRRGGLQVSARG